MGGNRQTHSQPSRTSTFPVMVYPCLFVRNVSIARKRGKINASRVCPSLSLSLCRVSRILVPPSFPLFSPSLHPSFPRGSTNDTPTNDCASSCQLNYYCVYSPRLRNQPDGDFVTRSKHRRLSVIARRSYAFPLRLIALL